MSTLTGIVRDRKSGAPIANVLVTELSQTSAERSVVTDAEGRYTIPDVPAGAFSLRFENGGFEPAARGGVALGGDQVLRFDVEMLPIGFRSGAGPG